MPFDTAEYIEELKISGVPEEHAKVQVKLLVKALKSEDIATKWDIKSIEASTIIEIEKVRGEIKALETSTTVAIKELETSTTVAIKELETSTTVEIGKVRGDIKALELSTTLAITDLGTSTKISISESKTEIIKWMTGIVMAQIGLIIAAIKLLQP